MFKKITGSPSNARNKHYIYRGTIIPHEKIEKFTYYKENIKPFKKGTKDRRELEKALDQTSLNTMNIPIVIGDEEYRTDMVMYQIMPHSHENKVAKFYWATPDIINKAIDVAVEAQAPWDRIPLDEKIKIWRTAGDLISKKYRMDLIAATMLGQSKTVIQAEIDICKLTDFIRYNAYSVKELAKYNPISKKPKEVLNNYRCRGLEGFVAAISPFNSTAIGGNLAYAPALMGCAVVWKPSDTAMLSSYIIFKILREAGVPSGVVNFVPSNGPVFGNIICSSPYLAGINFTGSGPTFNILSKQVGQNTDIYYNIPRMVGELGGKNYHFVHPSADVRNVVMSTIRGAFEYSGQNCYACSRMYIPESLWHPIIVGLTQQLKKVKMGNVTDYGNFLSAVINEKAFNRIQGTIDNAKAQTTINASIIAGGSSDKTTGYFIEPTIIEVKYLSNDLITDEILGPVLAVYMYADKEVQQILQSVCDSTEFALSGSIFAKDKKFIKYAAQSMRETAGNLYINGRSEGVIVGQQPFGGARKSGTNDRAGGPHYILRWASPQTIKESFVLSK